MFVSKCVICKTYTIIILYNIFEIKYKQEKDNQIHK